MIKYDSVGVYRYVNSTASLISWNKVRNNLALNLFIKHNFTPKGLKTYNTIQYK
jgi:hypothetical protein